jgi:dipeptidyl aminopeptidase/acylaminoacyl peptidase
MLLALIATQAVADKGTRDDYERARSLPERSRDTVFRDRVTPHWFDGDSKLWYRVRTGRDRHEFVLVDALAGRRDPAFDHARMALALSEELGREIEPGALPLERLMFADDLKSFTFEVDGRRLRVDRVLYKVEPAPREDDKAQAAMSPERGPAPRASRRTGDETEITLVNRTKGRVLLYWLDTSGERKPYGALEAGEQRRQHTFAGHVWAAIDEAGRELLRVEATDEPERALIDDTPKAAREEQTKSEGSNRDRRPRGTGVSPDGRWAAMVRDFNVVVRDTESGETFALSTDGTADDPYQGDMRWSPDSSRLVVLQVRPAQEHTVTIVESSPSDQVQPKVKTINYLKPGDQIAHPRPRLFDVIARKQVPIADSLFPEPWSIERVRWDENSKRFTFLYNQRGHQVLRLIAIDATTGAATALIDERSKTFIDYAGKMFLHRLDGSGDLIWMSERSGWNHLYRIDGKTGAVKNPISKGDWAVRRVERVDETKGQVWFWAGGVRAGQDPYQLHLCRAALDGSAFTVLTEGDGTHSATFSPEGRFFLDTWSRVDHPPVTELRRAEDGALVARLEEADASALLATGWRPAERFVAKGRDNATDIHGIIITPSNFDPKHAYPVIESIYAGPQGSHVPKSWGLGLGERALAELGFVVVLIDGMGTNWRSKAFHDVCWKNLGDAARPWMDLKRVGIFGGSAGGQNAVGALLRHGDFYKAAAADCGCHDNRMDKIWWNELWMGWPVDDSYEKSSNVALAHRLTGHLLLIVGELDTNVDPASTMQVVNALIKADKDFDLLVVPGAGHGAGGSPYGRRRQHDFFVRNLLGVEPRRESP